MAQNGKDEPVIVVAAMNKIARIAWKMLKNKVYSYARAPYELGWLKQADARRIMHDYHHAGDDPFQPQYRPANIYSGKGAHRWEPFLPEEAYGPKEAPQTDCADANQ